MAELRELTFSSGGARCGAWHVPATTDELRGADGRPCVVMAHGFACTRDGGLLPFAERFAAVGLDVLLFDYRGFGTSTGRPRQDVDHRRHREDYHAALAAARSLPQVDAARVALWGTSYPGDTSSPWRLPTTTSRPWCPRVPRWTASPSCARTAAVARDRPVRQRGVAVATVRDAGRGLARRPPAMVPVSGRPGEAAVMTSPDGVEALALILGPTFRNEIRARGLLRIAANRPVRFGPPGVEPDAARDRRAGRDRPAGGRARGCRPGAGTVQVESFDCPHFSLYVGEVFEASVVRQAEFLVAQLAR